MRSTADKRLVFSLPPNTQAAHETAQAALRREMDSKQSRLKARLEQRIEERRISLAAGPNSRGQALGLELPELAELPGQNQQLQQQQQQHQLQSTGNLPELGRTSAPTSRTGSNTSSLASQRAINQQRRDSIIEGFRELAVMQMVARESHSRSSPSAQRAAFSTRASQTTPLNISPSERPSSLVQQRRESSIEGLASQRAINQQRRDSIIEGFRELAAMQRVARESHSRRSPK